MVRRNTVECANCGISFFVDDHRYKVSDTYFHNKDCRADFHRRTLTDTHQTIFLFLLTSERGGGYTYSAIAKQLVIPRSTVVRALRELSTDSFVRQNDDKWAANQEVEFWIRKK